MAIAASPDAAMRPMVLVVDDHPMNRALLERQLSQIGFRALCVADGAAAHAALGGGPFAAAVLDFRLPDTDGIALARSLRRAGLQAPLLGLTAESLADPGAWLDAGVARILAKPAGINQLREALAAVMKGSAGGGSASDAQAPARPRSAVDLDQLEEILGVGTLQDKLEILRIFRSSTTGVMSRLAEAVAARDRLAVGREAHRAKGASANAAAVGLAAHLAALERLATEAPWPMLERMRADADAAFADVCAQIDALSGEAG